MRRNFAQLNAGTGNDLFGFIFKTGEPADIFAALKHALNCLEGLIAERFKQFRRQLAHVLKHASTMPADQFEIGDCGEANLEIVRHRATVQRSTRLRNITAQ